jgi:hypothetical protein
LKLSQVSRPITQMSLLDLGILRNKYDELAA